MVKKQGDYNRYVILSIIIVIWIAIFIVILTQLNMITSTNSTVLAGVITSLITIISGFLAYRQTQENMRISGHTDEIWSDLLSSTKNIVGDLKEMQQILHRYSDLSPLKRSEISDIEDKINIFSVGEWLVTSYPTFFKNDENTYNALSKQIKNRVITKDSGFSISDHEILIIILEVLNAVFLTLYKNINDSRTTLAVISVFGKEMDEEIKETLKVMRKIRVDVTCSEDNNYDDIRPLIDEHIERIQSICQLELEMTRIGKRDEIRTQYPVPIQKQRYAIIVVKINSKLESTEKFSLIVNDKIRLDTNVDAAHPFTKTIPIRFSYDYICEAIIKVSLDRISELMQKKDIVLDDGETYPITFTYDGEELTVEAHPIEKSIEIQPGQECKKKTDINLVLATQNIIRM